MESKNTMRTSIFIGSAQDIAYIKKELGLLITVNASYVDTSKKSCAGWYTQAYFEKMVRKFQIGGCSIQKIGICRLVDDLKKLILKMNAPLRIIAYDGSKENAPAIELILATTQTA